MAVQFIDGSWQDTRSQDERIAAEDSPAGSTRYNGSSGRIDVAPGIDVGAREAALKQAARESGLDYHASDLEGFLRNTGYQTGGVSPDVAWGNALENYRQRASNTPGAAHQSSSNTPVAFNDASEVRSTSRPPTGGGQGQDSRGPWSGQTHAPPSPTTPPSYTPPGYVPLTPEQLAAAQAHGSPVEHAMATGGQAAVDELNAATTRLYAPGPTGLGGVAPSGSQINWYDPASYRFLTTATGGNPTSTPWDTGPAGDAPGGTNSTNRPGGTATRPTTYGGNTQPVFTDPATRLVEDSALARRDHLTNPDPNSGTALFEKYARELIDTLRGPVYSAGDEAIIKGSALDTIMAEQDRTIQQWLEMTAARGLSPSSGPVLQGILNIKNQFQQYRTQVEATFARDAIEQTRQQRFQALDTASRLSGSEETRLREALTLAGVPLSLQNDSFARNLQLVGAGGNPAQYLQQLMQLWQQGNYQQNFNAAQRADTAARLGEYIGAIFGGVRAAGA